MVNIARPAARPNSPVSTNDASDNKAKVAGDTKPKARVEDTPPPRAKPSTKDSTEAKAKHGSDATAQHLQHKLQGDGHGKKGGHGGHSPVDTANHAVHLAHEAHLAAEGVEGASHGLHKAGEFATQVNQAKTMASQHGRTANDLRKMARGITKLENAVNNGAGPKAAQKLQQAQKSYKTAKAAWEAEKPAVRAANQFLGEYAKIKDTAKTGAKVRVGQAALRMEKALAATRSGRAVLTGGRVLAHPATVKGLMVVGAGIEAYAGFIDSNNKTTAGKVANGALAGGGGALVMANPLVAVGDLVAPKGYKLSEVYRGGAGAISAIGEGVITGDTRAMDDFHNRSKNGDYGKVMKASSEAGDYWAKHGVGGGLKLGWDNLKWWLSN